MAQIRIDLTKQGGIVKPMNAVNNGPAGSVVRGTSNMEYFREAGIPYARNHDAAFSGYYGGEYSVDVHRIFPNFAADETDPASYLFGPTDTCVRDTHAAGTEVFYRLGAAIEHGVKKGTYPPADFAKWARICEHIIRHYTEGWAGGMTEKITYWEIWNEPDTYNADGSKPCWQGTNEEFIEFYCVVAKHLKQCFPHLKIGGPAFCSVWASEKFVRDFLKVVVERQVPLDFFSYHCYGATPKNLAETIDKANSILADCGVKTETNLNEWNYIKGWKEEFKYSVLAIHGIKGAAFTMACISKAQESANIDMLMYYDARPTMFCGAFDYYTCEKLKGYYPIMWYGGFYDLKAYVPCLTSEEGIYTLCGKGDDGKISCIVTYYTNDDNADDKKVLLDFGRDAKFEAFLLDETSDGESIGVTDSKEFVMKRHSCIMLKEI